MAQALRAVPQVPAGPAEVLEAHLRGERETALGVSCRLRVRGSGETWGLRGARREGLGEPGTPNTGLIDAGNLLR